MTIFAAVNDNFMANIKFLVRGKDPDKASAICVTARFGRDEKLMYATPLKIEPRYWDEKKQRAKVGKSIPVVKDEEAKVLNSAITAIETRLITFIADAPKNHKAVTKDTLKEQLDIHFGKKKAAAKDFHAFFEYYIDLCDTRMNGRRGGQTVSYKSKREYARTLYYIEGYEKDRKVRLDFEDIDRVFFEDFVSYLQSLNLSTNTIGHKVICIKALMKAATEMEINTNTKYQYFKNSSEETEAVALNEQELQQIADCDFSDNPHLGQIRDLFLIGCWTGLRFSDVIRLRSENVGDSMITIRQQKTDNPVKIPIHPVFRRIWDSYGGQLPLVISNQKFNDHIKTVCQRAGITETVLKSITRGGKRQTTAYEKWQLVSSHTARRSFATNLYRQGFPSIGIMSITGHKTETAFLKYIKVGKEEHAEMLLRHWQKSAGAELSPK